MNTISLKERDESLAYILQVPINSVDFVSRGRLQLALINLSTQANRAELAASEWMQRLYDENQSHPAFEKFSPELKSKMETARIARQQQTSKKDSTNGQ